MTEEHCKNCEALAKQFVDMKSYADHVEIKNGELRAEVERLKAPWLCDCHTWPGPDEVHKYLVAVEAEQERLRREIERLNNLPLVQEIEERYRQIDDLHAEVERLKEELQRLWALPEQEWAAVGAIVLQVLASAAKAGYPVRETDAVKAIDRGTALQLGIVASTRRVK